MENRPKDYAGFRGLSSKRAFHAPSPSLPGCFRSTARLCSFQSSPHYEPVHRLFFSLASTLVLAQSRCQWPSSASQTERGASTRNSKHPRASSSSFDYPLYKMKRPLRILLIQCHFTPVGSQQKCVLLFILFNVSMSSVESSKSVAQMLPLMCSVLTDFGMTPENKTTQMSGLNLCYTIGTFPGNCRDTSCTKCF